MCIPFDVTSEDAGGSSPAEGDTTDDAPTLSQQLDLMRTRAERAEREAEIWKAQAEGRVPTAAKYMSQWVGELQALEADCVAKNRRIIECLERIMELTLELDALREENRRLSKP